MRQILNFLCSTYVVLSIFCPEVFSSSQSELFSTVCCAYTFNLHYHNSNTMFRCQSFRTPMFFNCSGGLYIAFNITNVNSSNTYTLNTGGVIHVSHPHNLSHLITEVKCVELWLLMNWYGIPSADALFSLESLQ